MIEVRCCCKPEKLLGWLPVSREPVVGTCMLYRFVEYSGPGGVQPTGLDWQNYRTVTVILPIERFEVVEVNGLPRSWAALKSEETPIETLRKIPGFVENKEHENLETKVNALIDTLESGVADGKEVKCQ